jgi:hypothetical protein
MYQVGGENWFFRALVPVEAEEEKGGKRGEGVYSVEMLTSTALTKITNWADLV